MSVRVLPVPRTAALGGVGSVSHTVRTMCSSDCARTRRGSWPVKSSYATTPREYTSLAVVNGRPRICSGLA